MRVVSLSNTLLCSVHAGGGRGGVGVGFGVEWFGCEFGDGVGWV